MLTYALQKNKIIKEYKKRNIDDCSKGHKTKGNMFKVMDDHKSSDQGKKSRQWERGGKKGIREPKKDGIGRGMRLENINHIARKKRKHQMAQKQNILGDSWIHLGGQFNTSFEIVDQLLMQQMKSLLYKTKKHLTNVRVFR